VPESLSSKNLPASNPKRTKVQSSAIRRFVEMFSPPCDDAKPYPSLSELKKKHQSNPINKQTHQTSQESKLSEEVLTRPQSTPCLESTSTRTIPQSATKNMFEQIVKQSTVYASQQLNPVSTFLDSPKETRKNVRLHADRSVDIL
jgi:hypothetical protein